MVQEVLVAGEMVSKVAIVMLSSYICDTSLAFQCSSHLLYYSAISLLPICDYTELNTLCYLVQSIPPLTFP